MEYLILGNGRDITSYDTPTCALYKGCPGNTCPHLCANRCPVYTVKCAKPATAGLSPTSLGMSD